MAEAEIIQRGNDVAKVCSITNTNPQLVENFLNKLPHNKLHLRLELALQYFIQKEPLIENVSIQKDVDDIVSIFNHLDPEVVYQRLKPLHNFELRKEIVIRQILHDKSYYLKKILDSELGQDSGSEDELIAVSPTPIDVPKLGNGVAHCSRMDMGENSEVVEVEETVSPPTAFQFQIDNADENGAKDGEDPEYDADTRCFMDMIDSIFQQGKEEKLGTIRNKRKNLERKRDVAGLGKKQVNNNERPYTPDQTLRIRTDLTQKLKPKRRKLVSKINGVEKHPIDLTQSFSFADFAVPGPSCSHQAPPIVIDEASSSNYEERLYYKLIEIFPTACRTFIKNKCQNRIWADLDDVVADILSGEYPEASNLPESNTKEPEVDPEEQFEFVKALLPDADPSYLQMQCSKLADQPAAFQAFIDNALRHKDYPTLKSYLRNQQLSAQQKQYTTDFNVENFLNLFPDPKAYFWDPKRTGLKNNLTDSNYIARFFRNHFPRLPLTLIKVEMERNQGSFLHVAKALQGYVDRNEVMKSKRKLVLLPDTKNIPLLQEIAYFEHSKEILQYRKEQLLNDQRERAEAKLMGLLVTCECCYDGELMPKDAFSCENGCVFCRECIRKSTEVLFGDGKLTFPCLAGCTANFNLHLLQKVLPPKMFSKIAQKQALEEVKAAGIEDLEGCPFCDFASIPTVDDKIFRCMNPDCMKESCRLCKEPSHVPLKCDEVEKDEEVKARVFLEDQMTEALLRKCWKCGTKFYKEEGCNKMTCSCGATMCYVCSKPVSNYKHFNGLGGDAYNLCPLYSDTNALNEQNVVKAAEMAKAQIDPDKLKHDPSADVKQHYKEKAKKNPNREPYLDVLNQMNGHGPRANGPELMERVFMQANANAAEAMIFRDLLRLRNEMEEMYQ